MAHAKNSVVSESLEDCQLNGVRKNAKPSQNPADHKVNYVLVRNNWGQ